MLRPSWIAFFTLVSCLAALPALADEGDPPPPPRPDPAKIAAKLAELVQKGTALCAAGELDDGLAALNAAWMRQQDVDVAVALGSCEVRAQAWPVAAEHLAFALRGRDDAEMHAALDATFANVRARVGAVKVTVTVDGADVFVGDRLAGQSPLPAEVYVAPGTTRISAKKTGYGEVGRPVTVQAAGTATVTLDLNNASAVASQASRRQGQHPSIAPAIVLGGVGLALAGVGAALLVGGVSKGSAAGDLLADLQNGNPNAQPCAAATPAAGCTTLASLRSGHDVFVGTGTGFLIAGGAALAAALGYGLWASFSTPSDSTALTLLPVASPSGGALLLHGTF
jgi:PEGA domain